MNILAFVLIVTEIFFVLSILFFFILIFARILSSYKVKFDPEDIKKYQDIIKNRTIVPKKHKEFIQFCYALGMIMDSEANIEEKNLLTVYIDKYNILNRLIKDYKKALTLPQKIYYLLLISLLRNDKARFLYQSILNHKQEYQLAIEFKIISLLGISSICKSKNDLEELLNYLISIDKYQCISQKMSQFFFSLATQNMAYSEIADFIESKHDNDIKNMIVFCAFLYAIPNINPNYTVIESIRKLQNRIPNDTMLLVATIRIIHQSGGDVYDLLLRYYNDESDALRIVCSKIALDIVTKIQVSKFLPYLYDKNLFVRANMIESIIKHNMTLSEILYSMKIHNSDFCKIKLYYEMSKIDKTRKI